jgi:CRP/FNR family transcriptional regulator, anaerobic regulatory protein
MLAQAQAERDVRSPGFQRAVNDSVKMVGSTGAGCAECCLRDLCLPQGLSDAGMEEFRALVFAHRRLKFGQALYRAGESFQAIYLVRAGFLKTVVVLEDGREQVTGLYMSGDVLGMDGIASGTHASDAIALADSDICVVPYERLEAMSDDERPMRRHLHRLLSHEIVREQRMMLLLGTMSAEERVAAFLLNLSQRFSARGFSGSEFVLRMTREEIGSLLGMKLETVSRIFSRLQRDTLIEIEGKHVRIVSIEGLRELMRR